MFIANNMLFGSCVKTDKMNEILNNGGSLQGERHIGILWSIDYAFAQVMGKECCGHVREVGFWANPNRKKWVQPSMFDWAVVQRNGPSDN